MPITPADLSFTPEGIPFSSHFGDVYHTSAGGLGQSRHVFLRGNGLPARWQGHRRHTVLETGFGLGLNFLATWAAWRDDPQRCGCLHFVSVEKHPFNRHDLATLHQAWPELEPLAGSLQAAWPALLPGLHRLSFDDDRVVLTLALGDALEILPALGLQADSLYLDGFSPARNPDLWSPAIFAELARLAAPGATLATWSVSGQVRRDLQGVGFELDRSAGFGGKREMLTGTFAAKRTTEPHAAPRHALVIGAGVAGTSVAERLAARSWQVTLIDEASGPAQGASGNRAGVFRPLPSLDDNRLARITRAGFLYGRRHLARLAAQGHPVRWGATGVLHLARDGKQEGKMQNVVEAHQTPHDYLRFASREEASRIAGWPLATGGWWFPGGGWIQPPSLCAANLAAGGERITPRFGEHLDSLEWIDGKWVARRADGTEIARAPVAILASGVGIRSLPQAAILPVRPARGQVSHLPAEAASPPHVVVCRNGYVSPEVDGIRCAGATFVADDMDDRLRADEHRENLSKLELILPGYTSAFDPETLPGRVGFRPASPDRLPMVGAIPAANHADKDTPLADIPRHPGLYAISGFGARGLVWASLMGELLASRLHGDPLPLEQDLVDAVDPARYLLKPPRPDRSGDE